MARNCFLPASSVCKQKETNVGLSKGRGDAGGSTVSKTTEQSTHDAWQRQNSLVLLSLKASSSGWRKDRRKLGEIKCLGETWQVTRTFLHSSYTPKLYIYYKYLPSEAMNEGHWHLEPCISGAVFSGCWWATSFRGSASNNRGP